MNMNPTFLESYILTITAPFLATIALAITLAATKARLPNETLVKVMLGFGTITGLWIALATYMAKQGVMGHEAFPNGPPFIGLFFLLGAVFVWALARATPLTRSITDAMGHDTFMGLQSFRILGGIFLIGWAFGDIPWIFAIPAGFGDILAGILGFQAMRAVQRGAANARRKVIIANVVGISDFAVALGTGLITSDTIYQLMGQDAPNIVGEYPLVMIPAFLVPLFLGAHLLSVQRLMRDRPGQQLQEPA